MENKFHCGEYVFVREVSNESLRMNSRWHYDRLIGKEGRRIKVNYPTIIGSSPAVWASGAYWAEDDLMSVEEHKAIAQANKITLKEKDVLSVL